MKKLYIVPVLALLVISSLAMVSAIPVCATVETTFVSGTITDATNGNAPVDGADVTVTCNGNVKTTTSDSSGGYQVQYTPGECDYGDDVSVSASYGSLNGESDEVEWYTENNQIGCLEMIINVGCVDVPLVPEFIPLVAGMTILGALGAFFLVRRH